MSGKPTTFPAAQQALDHLPSQAEEHVPPDTFTFVETAAAAPDVSDLPASVLADVVPHASVGVFPGADHAFSHTDHLPVHVTDWFLA